MSLENRSESANILVRSGQAIWDLVIPRNLEYLKFADGAKKDEHLIVLPLIALSDVGLVSLASNALSNGNASGNNLGMVLLGLDVAMHLSVRFLANREHRLYWQRKENYGSEKD
jgi:hypothetical protein